MTLSETQASRQARPGRLLFATLVLATMMGPMALQMFFPAVPGVKTGLGVADALGQLTVSLPLFVMAFLTLAYGSLSDRLGRRPVLIGGILLFAAGSALSAAADTIWLLLAGRCVQAAGGACGVALARAIVRDVYGTDRLAKTIAYLTMAFALGPMLSVPLGGWLVAGYGWRSVLVFAALAGLVIALCVFLAVAESHPPAARRPGGGAAGLARDYGALLRNLRLQAFVWQSGATSGAFFVAAPASAIVMIDYLGYSPEAYGFWFPLFPAGFLLGNFAAGRLSGRVPVETMVLAGSLLRSARSPCSPRPARSRLGRSSCPPSSLPSPTGSACRAPRPARSAWPATAPGPPPASARSCSCSAAPCSPSCSACSPTARPARSSWCSA